MKHLLFTTLILITSFVFFQTSSYGQGIDSLDNKVYEMKEIDYMKMTKTIVEIAMVKMNELKYPDIKKKKRKNGTVDVEFILNKNGEFISYEVIKSLGDAYDKEALRVSEIIASRIWNPGLKDGKPVNVKLVIPFEFKE